MNYCEKFVKKFTGIALTMTAVFACGQGALAQTNGSVVWESFGYNDGDAIPVTTQYATGNSTLTVDWFLTTDGGTIIPYSGNDFVSYGGSTRGNTFGNLEVGFDNDERDQDDFFTLELIFNKAVDDLTFSVLDIDNGSGNWHDVVEVYYDDGTGYKNVSLNTALWSLAGNKVGLDDETYAVGWEGVSTNAGSTDASANIDLDFSTVQVTALRFVYFSGDDSQVNPAGQVSGISDMSWVVPAPPGPEDHSDAPLTGTLYGNAVHPIVSGIHMGASNTAETSGYNSINASADTDDGVIFPPLYFGEPATIAVDVSGIGGRLQGWIDWNDDGDWKDAGERIATDLQDTDNDGKIFVPVNVPAGAAGTETIARFRWSTTSGLGAVSTAIDGEVEDYAITAQTAPVGPPLSCPAGFTLAASSGNADTVIAPALNSTQALGIPETAGTTAGNGNSARLTSGNPLLTLDLTDLVPENAILPLTIAKNNSAASYDISVSADNSTYTTVTTYNTGTLDSLQPFDISIPSGGARYVRFQRNSGSLWVGGMEYSEICIPPAGVPELSGVKTVVNWDPLNEGLLSIPGNDMVYTISITNTGDLAVDADTVSLVDSLPVGEIEFWNGDLEAGSSNNDYPGTDPVSFVDNGSGLTFTYGTDIRFSTATTKPANFAACNVIAPDNSYRADFTFLCINPKGVMAAGDPDPGFDVSFRARIK